MPYLRTYGWKVESEFKVNSVNSKDMFVCLFVCFACVCVCVCVRACVSFQKTVTNDFGVPFKEVCTSLLPKSHLHF